MLIYTKILGNTALFTRISLITTDQSSTVDYKTWKTVEISMLYLRNSLNLRE